MTKKSASTYSLLDDFIAATNVWCHYICHLSLPTLERIQFSVSYIESIFAFHEAPQRGDQYLDRQKITFSFLCIVSCHFLSSLRYAKWQIEPLNQIKQINCLLVNHNQKAIWAVNAFNRVGKKNRKGRKKGKWVKNEGKGNADEKSTARIDKGRKFPFIDFDRGTYYGVRIWKLAAHKNKLVHFGWQKYLTGGQISQK